MNSRQRRVDRRHWQYRIHVVAESYAQYTEMWNWLVSRHGKKSHKCGWREGEWRYVDGITDRINTNWHFECERDLLEFTLRWAQ